MPKVSKKELKNFTDKIFGTDEELEEGMKERKPTIKESVMIEGTLHSKGKWNIEEEKKEA